MSAPSLANLEKQKRTIIDRHVRPSNLKAFSQVTTTLLPLAGLWVAVVYSADISYWLTALVLAAMTLLLMRVFVLMHECGHGSLFRNCTLNKAFGFVFGVVAGMPQYVWAQRHHYHHSTNGNWDKYRGPLNIIPADEYAAMSEAQQRKYRNARSIWLAPLAGFLYLIVNPRMTWLKGTFGLVRHIVKAKIAQPGVSIKAHAQEYKTGLWASPQEYWHMFWNNIVLLSLWVAMAWAVGPALFFVCYIISVSLSGGGGILLFTVQHNFDHAYASGDEGWNYNRAAVDGTSFLVLPAWLNWMTANIAYHHIHHLSARIPNYCLAECHKEYADLFTDVTRIHLSQVPAALKCILWDKHSGRIVSVASYEQQTALRLAGSTAI